MEGPIFGIILGIRLRQALAQETFKQFRPHLAFFHDGHKVISVPQIRIQVNQFKGLYRHGVMVAAIPTRRPALDSIFMLGQHSLQIEGIGPVVFFGKVHNHGNLLRQVVWTDRRFPSKRLRHGIEAVPFLGQELSEPTHRIGVRPGREVFLAQTHGTKYIYFGR
jgi:hypothetical protein